MKSLTAFLFFVGLSFSILAQDEARLMRFPAIHGNQIVFSYAGDLYTVDKTGGLARKLTNYIGYEMFARFSPDGKTIAFTGEYDGNREIYTMPADGGTPTRLTYTATLGRDDISDRMGPNNIVLTWKDNDTIIYRSRCITFNDFVGQLFAVSAKGGLSKQLPLPRGGWCSYSPDKQKLAYNRIFREFRTWKYYKGGMADDIWIYDFATKKTENITNNAAQDIFPMWAGDKVYFLSDRDRIMNIFCYDTKTKETRKITNFDIYDVKFPSLGDNAIVFENGGFVYVLNLSDEKYQKVSIRISDDFINSRDVLVDASQYIHGWDVSPDGKRLLFEGRGEIFTVPAEEGITRNLTKSSGAHDRNPAWSPDGKYIAFISDMTGEDEIYITEQDGSKPAVQLTTGSETYKYDLVWSPDSKKLLWADKMLRLQYIDITTKKITQVDKAERWEFNSYTWSPDSKWIAYNRPEVETESNIYLYEVATATKTSITDGWYDSGGPEFSNDGKYLFFTSSRDYNPVYSWVEWNYAYTDMNRVYFIPLSKSTPNPFELKNDETEIKKEEVVVSENKTSKKDDKKAPEVKKTIDMKVDLDGIQSRILVIPGEPGRYWNIKCIDDKVYYVRAGTNQKPVLKLYDLKKEKETDLGDITNYTFSADYKKMAINKDGSYFVIDVPSSKPELSKKADLSGMKVMIDKQQEWNQIFLEAWRQMRDFFYDPNMHGVDWKAIKDKYQPLVKYVNHRDDLNYIIGEMIGELSVGHAYVGGGDRPQASRIKMGLLGAKLSQDAATGFYRIDKILAGQNWDQSLRSPLTELGLNVKEGYYILAVNGEPVNKMINIYQSLVGMADKEVQLTINSKPETAGSWNILVKPVDDEADLYYYNWVQENIKKVSDATGGKVGYIHIPDMGVAGLNEFVKYFYPQLAKKALIIDDRGNGGGNVSPMIIERLRREMSRANMSRNTIKSQTPREMLVGPKICLINEYSASDGDLFPWQFKKHDLGLLVGKRTWGGVVGIRGSLPFVDNAFLNRPEFATYDENGWIIEGYGVDPDVFVDNDPAKEWAGVDEQLNKAIELILIELKKNPQEVPDIPKFPVKTK